MIASADEDPSKEITSHIRIHMCSLNCQTFIQVIDIRERVNVLGEAKCQALVDFHHFTGADWEGKFVGKNKRDLDKESISRRQESISRRLELISRLLESIFR